MSHEHHAEAVESSKSAHQDDNAHSIENDSTPGARHSYARADLTPRQRQMLFVQQTSGNAAAVRRFVQRQPAQADTETPRPLTPFELVPKIDKMQALCQKMVKTANQLGFSVAASHLQYYLDGKGGTKPVDVAWLRGFARVTDAEQINQKRFEKQLVEQAKLVAPGILASSFSDHWDSAIKARFYSELLFATGASELSSVGNFKLSKDGDTMTITGTVSHHWHDDYNWNKGAVELIPVEGVTLVKDDDMQLLETYRDARTYKLEATWVQQVIGTVQVNSILPNSEDFTWSGP